MEVPQQTVYASNLNEKVNKQELRRSLYTHFSQYGRILDVVALKTRKMRGQAFIVFTDLASASQAIRRQQGNDFYGRPIRLTYSKSKSYAAMKEDGTYAKEMKDRLKKDAPKAAQKPKADKAIEAPKAAEPAAGTEEMETEAQEDEPDANSILFVGNLPEGTTATMLEMLFTQCPGFKEVRPAKAGIAFVEYETVQEAMVAKEALQGFQVDTSHAMSITYAKK